MAEDSRKNAILTKINRDLLSADLQWSLLVAALSSYRHDTVLRPFPPMFIKDGTDFKDYTVLEKIVADVPSLTSFKSEDVMKDLKSIAAELLLWTFTTNANFQLESCSLDKMAVIEGLTDQQYPVPSPTHIFQIKYSDTAEEKFAQIRKDRDLLYAYHGTRLENCHTILHYGLHAHMNKNGIFGEGTYLSSELSVSLPYSPTGTGWTHSIIGDKLSCIAVCEIIDDPRSVKCQVKKDKTNDASPQKENKNRGRIAGSESGDIPEKYYVVRNNDVIRLKYVLVYAEKSKSKRKNIPWYIRHKGVLLLMFYAFILLCVGLYNSKLFHYSLRKYVYKK